MTTAADRKIMMLNRLITSTNKKLRATRNEIEAMTETLRIKNAQIHRLMELVKGNGAKAPIPADLQPCYDYTLDYVTKLRYNNNTRIATFKCVADNSVWKPSAELKGKIVVDWVVEKLEEGLYNLTYVGEWVY